MPARKRVIEEVDPPNHGDSASVDPSIVKIRNMWQFACLMQFIYTFGDVLKISKDVDVETLEMECCRPTHSELLSQIGLALLKFVSSHRGLTPDLFDEYARRQYDSKAPNHPNPFGYDEEPLKFADFTVALKLRILHQLSVWTMNNPDRIRQALADEDSTSWRIEPFGWDRHDRTYYLLDDNRLYRKTDPVSEPPKKVIQKPKKKQPPPPPPPKSRGWRSSKRQKLANGVASDSDQQDADHQDEPLADQSPTTNPPAGEDQDEDEDSKDNGLDGAKWECIAVTLQDYQNFTDGLKSTKDANEKVLRDRLITDTFPILEKAAADQERKAAQKRRELENIQRLALAKRSGRIADRAEKLKEQREAEEAERKRKEELAMAKKEHDRQLKIEKARESRMITREQRLRDREMRRILNEQQLAELESQSQSGAENLDSRISERRRLQQLEAKRKELDEIVKSDEDWYFDCSICGIHGKNLDDGTHSIACDKCDVWQHLACHGIKEEVAEREDFHFVCSTCQNPRPLKLNATEPEPVTKPQPVAAPTPKKKRGRKPKVVTEGEEQPKKRQKPSGERKRKPKNKQDPTHPQLNGSMHDPSGHPQHHFAPDAQASVNLPPPTGLAGANHNSYLPRPGYFPPATNGTNPRNHDIFFNYHQGNYSPHHSYHSPASPTRPAYSSPPQLHTNGAPTNTSHVTWQNQTQPNPYHNSVPHQSHPSPPFNPYSNDFARQRGSPHVDKSPNPQSSDQLRPQPIPQNPASHFHGSPPSGMFATTRTPSHTEHHRQPSNPIQLPPLVPSPTPSFSATQGNTAVRFSPTQTPHNPHSNSNLNLSSAANSYAPTHNVPSISAVSPVKQSSSPAPPLPPASYHPTQGLGGGPPIPKFDSPPQQGTAGISPMKQELPPIMSQPSPNAGLGITDANRTVNPLPSSATNLGSAAPLFKSSSNTQSSKPPSSMQHLLNSSSSTINKEDAVDSASSAVPPVPVLSPSVGLAKGVEPAPQKLSTSPSLPPLTAGLQNHIQATPSPEASKSPNPTTDNVQLPPIEQKGRPSPEPVKSPSGPNPEFQAPLNST